MRRPSLQLLAMTLLLASACSRPGEWHELAVSEGGFGVLMRGQPRYVRQPVDTPGGRTVAHFYSSERPEAFCAVGYSDYPLGHVLGSNPDELLSGVRDTWIGRVQGRLVLSSPALLDGKYPGLEFAAEGQLQGQKTYLHARVFLVDQRLYQVIAIGRKGEVAQGVLNRFLNSFRLLPSGGAASIHITPPRDEK